MDSLKVVDLLSLFFEKPCNILLEIKGNLLKLQKVGTNVVQRFTQIYTSSFWEYVLQQFTNVTYMLRTLKRFMN